MYPFDTGPNPTKERLASCHVDDRGDTTAVSEVGCLPFFLFLLEDNPNLKKKPVGARHCLCGPAIRRGHLILYSGSKGLSTLSLLLKFLADQFDDRGSGPGTVCLWRGWRGGAEKRRQEHWSTKVFRRDGLIRSSPFLLFRRPNLGHGTRKIV